MHRQTTAALPCGEEYLIDDEAFMHVLRCTKKGCCSSGVDHVVKPNERRKGKGGNVYQIHTITIKSKAKRLVEALQTDAPAMIWVNSVRGSFNAILTSIRR